MTNKKPNLSDCVRNNIVQFILSHYKEGSLKLGTLTKAATQFGVHRRTITTIWTQAKEQMEMGLPVYLTNQKQGLVRQKHKLFDPELFKTIMLKRRSTIRRAAQALGVGKSTFWRWKQAKQIRTHSNAIKISLTSAQKLLRLQFCMQSIAVDTTINKFRFKSMAHIVHIDEKWPIYDSQGLCIFDGKIRMYPFIEQVPAQRSSVNRAAGTLETKAITSITREVMKDYMINRVVPDLKALWPLTEGTNIVIQQDNARPHFSDDDIQWRAVVSSDGFNIHLMQQPALSPDLNVNDLGWFRALQSIQEEEAPMNVDELVLAVLTSFQKLEPMKLNFVFLSLQSCMVEIMMQRGHNNYRLPHMKKQTLLREGALPEDLEVDNNLVSLCVDYYVDAGLNEAMLPVILELMKLEAEQV
ncbi:uncharacterized protein LOC124917393 [Impatiens glandulifera]|uniref:uncharacterized protein LOC124917393 n=1 Tax=Impatiens glandulifera TaxID=253017 RepID=UPI001FB061E7|nr:uncharacterized protein LOC124917393 [Impatiens glandulifera]